MIKTSSADDVAIGPVTSIARPAVAKRPGTLARWSRQPQQTGCTQVLPALLSRAFEAHHRGDHQRVARDAGIALATCRFRLLYLIFNGNAAVHARTSCIPPRPARASGPPCPTSLEGCEDGGSEADDHSCDGYPSGSVESHGRTVTTASRSTRGGRLSYSSNVRSSIGGATGDGGPRLRRARARPPDGRPGLDHDQPGVARMRVGLPRPQPVPTRWGRRGPGHRSGRRRTRRLPTRRTPHQHPGHADRAPRNGDGTPQHPDRRHPHRPHHRDTGQWNGGADSGTLTRGLRQISIAAMPTRRAQDTTAVQQLVRAVTSRPSPSPRSRARHARRRSRRAASTPR